MSSSALSCGTGESGLDVFVEVSCSLGDVAYESPVPGLRGASSSSSGLKKVASSYCGKIICPSFCAVPRASGSSQSDGGKEKLLEGVEEHERSVDPRWIARGDDGAEEGVESSNALDWYNSL